MIPCYSCGEETLQAHCGSEGCDLIRCTTCKSFGKSSGDRWFDARKSEHPSVKSVKPKKPKKT